MSNRKILVLAVVLPALGMTVYTLKHSGKQCGGELANTKEYLCPTLYECVLESNKPNALGACRFLPNGLRLSKQPPLANVVIDNPPLKDPAVEYDIKTQKARRLTLVQNKFGFEVLKDLVFSDQASSRNILISPVNLGLALSLLYNGADGSTKDQMSNVLQVQGFSLYELNEVSKILIDRLNTPTAGITLDFTNSIWIKDGIELNGDLVNNAQTNYNTHLANLNFSDPQAPGTINSWISDKTSGKFQNAVTEEPGPKTVSYVINTEYFNGIWKYKFENDKIETRDFTRQDGTKTPVTGMKMERRGFLYLENNLFQAVKLFYGPNEKYSMIVVLPKYLEINNLLGNFDIVNWQRWTSSFYKKDGTLYLPKFEISYGEPLIDTLKNTGLTLPVDPANADFSKLSADSAGRLFYISSMLHKTYINVADEGLEIAPPIPTPDPTVTVLVTPKPEDLPFVMDVNKPFFFAIVNEETQANLLTGIVRDL